MVIEPFAPWAREDPTIREVMMLGVVIGRFQVESLHPGHRYLISEALRQHPHVLVLVGCSPIRGTRYDPLDYFTRERMLRAEYPDVKVLPIEDHVDDDAWSRAVDAVIEQHGNGHGARLYGGRDSFQRHYTGTHEAIEIDSGVAYESGSDQRAAIGRVERGSPDFRAGVIYATQNRHPYVQTCVDIVCLRESEVLLGRKATEKKWRLPGGTVEPGETLEQAAAREFSEETGLTAEVPTLHYCGSAQVADWRFKHVAEVRLLSAVFRTQYQWGAPRAGSDLIDVQWFALDQADRSLMRGHRKLLEMAVGGVA